MPDLAQHVIVTLAALGAAAIIVRRVFGAVVSRSPSASPCASCPSAQKHGVSAVPAASGGTGLKPAGEPMILVRRGTRDA